MATRFESGWAVRRSFCLCLGWWCLFTGGLQSAKPNVVLLMADDLGWGDVGFNGNRVIQTPHLDAMAANGIRFTRFYAAAPVCSPTRGSCLTGRHPFRYGIPYANSGHLKPEEITLAEVLKDEGYATAHFGKWHLGTLTKTVNDANRGGPRGEAHYAPPQEHGFDVCFSTESKVPTHAPLRVPKVFAEGASRKIGWDSLDPEEEWEHYNTRYWNERGEEVTEPLLDDDSKEIMDRTLPFMERAIEKEQPFLAVIWFHAPHLPVVASDRHRKPYEEYPLHERNYYGCITALDEQVGRLRESLRALDVADDTMLWFCSDNGPEGNAGAPGSAGPFRGRKRSLYEGGVRVPGVLEWPAMVKQARSTDFAAVTSDYFPTVLDVLGRLDSFERTLDGTSLMPLIRGEVDQRAEPIGFFSRGRVAWHEGVDKLVFDEDGPAGMREWYKLDNDLGETKNWRFQKGLSSIFTAPRMREAALEWLASCRRSNAGAEYRAHQE